MSEILHQREFFGTHEKKTERIVTEEKIWEGLGAFGQFWAEKIYGDDCGFIRGESGEITGLFCLCRKISGITGKLFGGNIGEI